MKKTLTIIILSAGLLFTGCKKWLDVKPQGESTQEELFKTQKGFRDALTGAYIRMKGDNVYGSALTWGNIEYMAANWENANTSNTAIPALIAGNYTNQTVRDWMDATYQDLYKVIADVNGVLSNIDGKQSVFTEGNYELIKGEALALRAFCHFDALRMFGPMPSNPGTGMVLPYVKEVSKNIHEPLGYQD
ncbi:MAG TPA: RagB/SusD family nutrient uptake outer membrane protein, partial [Pedobacter sp.]|uniref:RagB/SusD family nutrient uptake outer membrane protein n=1 Tax=Pedobacter sp. TaxID=1411316 RepID=UPI002CB09E42